MSWKWPKGFVIWCSIVMERFGSLMVLTALADEMWMDFASFNGRSAGRKDGELLRLFSGFFCDDDFFGLYCFRCNMNHASLYNICSSNCQIICLHKSFGLHGMTDDCFKMKHICQTIVLLLCDVYNIPTVQL